MLRLHSLASASLFALAAMAPDTGGSPAATTPAAPTASPVAEFEFPNLDGKQSVDCSKIPADVRLDFLKGAVRAYIANRLNGVHTRHEKDEKVAAWNAYEAAIAADPLQSTVAKPDFDKPAAPDYLEAFNRAVADLEAGNVRRQGSGGEPKQRTKRDPVTATVTDVVTREVFDARRAADPKYTYLNAKKEVGTDGIAYLNRLIDAKVEAGADRTALEKMRDTKYVNPAKAMHGLTTTKALNDLPSIL